MYFPTSLISLALLVASCDSSDSDHRYLRRNPTSETKHSSRDLAYASNDMPLYDDEGHQSTGPHSPVSPSTSKFNIALVNMGEDTSYDHLFKRAARKWEQIVIGDLPDMPQRSYSAHDWFGNEWEETVNVDIDDVLIGYSTENIDGLGGVLGFAGPIYSRRSDDSVTAVSGVMKFDGIDFSSMSESDIALVIIHEMGHVLGIGTFWHFKCGSKCEMGRNIYTCDKAVAEYKALGFTDSLKLESEVCGHWAEDNFLGTRDEIMTPYFDEKHYQPLSTITSAALYDLGYEVNFDASDAWENDRYLRVSREDVIVPSRSFVLNETNVKRPKMLSLDE